RARTGSAVLRRGNRAADEEDASRVSRHGLRHSRLATVSMAPARPLVLVPCASRVPRCGGEWLRIVGRAAICCSSLMPSATRLHVAPEGVGARVELLRALLAGLRPLP